MPQPSSVYPTPQSSSHVTQQVSWPSPASPTAILALTSASRCQGLFQSDTPNRPNPCICQWMLQPCPAQSVSSPSSYAHDWELQPSRRVPKFPLLVPFPARILHVPADTSTQPCWLASISVLTGKCCNLALPSINHILSWLLHMPAGVTTQPSLVCPQTQPIHMLTSAAAWPGPPPAPMLPSRSCSMAGEISKLSYQTCPQPQMSHMPLGAVALLDMICPQSWSLHVLVGAAAGSYPCACPSSSSSKYQVDSCQMSSLAQLSR